TIVAWGHERRFRDVRDEFGLPPTPERLWQRSEPTLRVNNGYADRSPKMSAVPHRDCVSAMTGVSQIADDLLHRPSRPSRAKALNRLRDSLLPGGLDREHCP